jgi:hypothetical protein
VITTAAPPADLAEIRRALGVLLEPGATAELRVLHAGRDGTVSGYFDDPDALAREAARWSGRAPGVFVTLNPVVPALLARAANRVRGRAEQTTSDRDVLRHRWLPIDLDPVRPAGISATEAEHGAALIAAQAVRAELRAVGWPDPLFADSGNGAHLLCRVDLPNDDASTACLRRCLEALALRFDDDAVRVDVTTCNPARIWKVYGTLAAKGDATADRPHRLARLLDVPDTLAVVAREPLARLAATAPEAPPDPGRNGHGPGFDLEAWLVRYADRVRVVARGPWNGGARWILNPCPWNPEHGNRAAYIVRFASGAIAAGCHHNGCAGRDWSTLRELVEPGWWARREPRDASGQRPGRTELWSRAQPAPEFLSVPEAELDFLEARQLARGSITEWFSPRGLGKTHAAHALMVKHAQLGRRVLLIDRDNSRREVRRRLRGWGAATASALRVLTRDHAPALTDRPTWEAFPFHEYDLIVIDSIDAATEGVGEQDSAKPASALAPLLDIARREAGPAILVLGNVIKSGLYGRGSGVVEDRADIVYEVRDATEFQPTGTQAWWLELPAAGREAWGARAVRRRRRDRYRLAFVPSKYRIGEEPDPFVLELDLAAEPWQLRDVTVDLEAAGQAAVAAAAEERAARLSAAGRALEDRIHEQADAGAAWTMGQAETFLVREHDLRQREARRLLRDGTGTRWLVSTDSGRRGHPRLLFPVTPRARGGELGVTTRDVDEKERRAEELSSVTRMDSGRRETRFESAAPDAVIHHGGVSRHPENIPPGQMGDDDTHEAEVSAGADVPGAGQPRTWEEV